MIDYRCLDVHPGKSRCTSRHFLHVFLGFFRYTCGKRAVVLDCHTKHRARLFRHTITLVDAFADDPDDLFSAAHDPLLLFLPE